MKGTLITIGVIAFLAIGFIAWAVGISNDEKRIKLRGEAQQEVCEAFFSNMWEILQSKAGVADEYKEAFKEIYLPLIEGRYQDDNLLMKWITESNPTFDPSLYKDLMVAIEAQRNGFFLEQAKLIDIDREHKTMKAVFPASMIIGQREPIGGPEGIVILKNVATTDAYTTGTDASPALFNRDKK